MADAHSTPEQEDLRLETVVRNHVEQILGLAGGNIAMAARMLEMSRSTLYNWMERGCTPKLPDPIDDDIKIEPERFQKLLDVLDKPLPPKIEPKPAVASAALIEVICFHCRLVQFRPLNGNCRRCFTKLTNEGVIA